MSDFNKGDYVRIRDYPFGHVLNLSGVVVGVLANDYYNVLMKSGISEGKIIKYNIPSESKYSFPLNMRRIEL